MLPLVGFAGPAQAQLSWNVTFADQTAQTGVGFDDLSEGAGRRDAVLAALATISSQFDGRGAIRVTVGRSETDGTGPAASANTLFANANGFQNGAVYQRATTGIALFPNLPDATATFDFGFGWSTSGSAGGYDIQSVALHEFTHALGFGSLISESGQGGRNQTLGSPDLYDSMARYYQVGTGSQAVSLLRPNASFNTSQATAADLAGNNVTFNGQFATAANGGNPVAIYAPSAFDPTASLSHVDPAAPGMSGAVMQPGIGTGDVRRGYQAFEVGMLIDAGWNRYTWATGSANWGDNKTGVAASPWRNFENKASLSPTGVVTPNVVLTFTGSRSVGYTSTNNLNLAANGDRFLVNRVVLDSTSAGTNVIAAADRQVLRFDTTIGVTPQISQQNGGAFDIRHAVEFASAGLALTGNGSGVVTLSGTVSATDGSAGLVKSGASEFVLAGANTYAGGTTVDAGTLRVANASGSATGSGSVTVGSGGTLAGLLDGPLGAGGIITGDVTVQGGGTVRPGELDASRAGQITFGGAGQSVRFESGSVYTWSLVGLTDAAADAGRGYDQLIAADGSGLNLGGGRVELAFSAATAPTAGDAFWSASHQWTLLDVAGGANTSSFRGLTNAQDYYSVGLFSLLSLTNGGVGLQFVPGAFTPVPVPEPATTLGVAAAGLGLLAAVRRRRAAVSRPG